MYNVATIVMVAACVMLCQHLLNTAVASMLACCLEHILYTCTFVLLVIGRAMMTHQTVTLESE